MPTYNEEEEEEEEEDEDDERLEVGDDETEDLAGNELAP